MAPGAGFVSSIARGPAELVTVVGSVVVQGARYHDSKAAMQWRPQLSVFLRLLRKDVLSSIRCNSRRVQQKEFGVSPSLMVLGNLARAKGPPCDSASMPMPSIANGLSRSGPAAID